MADIEGAAVLSVVILVECHCPDLLRRSNSNVEEVATQVVV